MKNIRDFWSGLIYMIVGFGAVYLARLNDYPMGVARSMGAGYFPTYLGWILAAIGVVSLVRSFIREGDELGNLAWVKIAYVTVAVVAFGLILPTLGLAVAVFAVVLISAYASRFFNLKLTVLIALGSSVFCCLVFVKGLGLPIPIFGPWLQALWGG